jgi:hypothetical protein
MSNAGPTSLIASESPHSVSLTADRVVAALDRRVLDRMNGLLSELVAESTATQ